jgi:hypothetical protein
MARVQIGVRCWTGHVLLSSYSGGVRGMQEDFRPRCAQDEVHTALCLCCDDGRVSKVKCLVYHRRDVHSVSSLKTGVVDKRCSRQSTSVKFLEGSVAPAAQGSATLLEVAVTDPMKIR